MIQAVKRNEARFPSSFRFQLTTDVYESLRSQIVTLKQVVTGTASEIYPLRVYRTRGCHTFCGIKEQKPCRLLDQIPLVSTQSRRIINIRILILVCTKIFCILLFLLLRIINNKFLCLWEELMLQFL